MEDRKLLMKKRFLKSKICFLLAAIVLILSIIQGSIAEQQWVLYHSKEIRGAVVDAETGKPLDGVVVIALWQLSGYVSEGFDGYAKIVVEKTDKSGKFKIPFWINFKPWKIGSRVNTLAPKIVIYKPGFKLYWSHRHMREGFPGDISLTSDEKTRIMEANSINPAKLKRVYADEEIWKNYLDLRFEANLSTDDYSTKQFKQTSDLIIHGLIDLQNENAGSRSRILNHMKQFEQ